MTDQLDAVPMEAVPAGAYAILERLFDMRHSCRGFRSDPVPEETIRRILAIARKTASWCNAQLWQLIITSGEATERFRLALLG